MIRLRLLGPQSLERDDGTGVRSVPLQPKRFALLAYLAASHPPSPRRRDTLLALFWPEADEKRARTSLRQILYRLRGSLGADALTGEWNERVGVDSSLLWCDVAAFDEALADGRREEALELYRGPFLEGFHLSGAPEFERWVEGERRRDRLRALEAAWTLAEAKEAEGDRAGARERAERALELAPYDGEGVRRYLSLMDRLGQPAAAIRAYEAYVQRLDADLDLEPSPETEALVARIRDGGRGPGAPASRAASPSPDVARASRGTAAEPSHPARAGREAGEDDLRVRSLAVLPLENLSGDPQQRYFTDGMTEALIAELGRIRALEKVTSRTSVMRYRETDKSARQIAGELGVDALVEGSVLRAGDDVRITVQLIHGPTDRHLWSRSYERDLRDVLTLQRDVARALASELRVTLTGREEARLEARRTVHPDAYTHYLMGNFQLGKISEAGFRQAVEHYEEAIAADPAYAPGRAGLAMAYTEMNTFLPLPPRAFHAEAKESALKALELDSSLAEAHMATGRIRQLFEWDLPGAEAAFRRGIELDPSATTARVHYQYYLILMGRHEEAVAAGRRALERDPLNPQACVTLAWGLHHLERHAEARTHLEKAAELAPRQVDPPLALAESFVQTEQGDEALRHARRAESLMGEHGLPTQLTRLAYVFARAGRRGAAEGILEEFEARAGGAYVAAGLRALMRLALGQEEEALDLLEATYEQREHMLPGVKGYYMFDPLRDEPRFQEIQGRFEYPGG